MSYLFIFAVSSQCNKTDVEIRQKSALTFQHMRERAPTQNQ